MIKVFLDSSVIVAAIGSSTGGSAKIVSLCGQKKLVGFISEGVIAESEEAIKENFSQEKTELFTKWLSKEIFTITPFPTEEKLAKFREVDLEDQHILAAAQETSVDFLISLDKKHILTPQSQKTLPNIKIITPKELLEEYRKNLG